MKKERQVKSYQRRTKSGKLVTVRAHTASYEAADKAKEAAKKEGAGKELEERKKKPVQLEIPFGKEEENKALEVSKEDAKTQERESERLSKKAESKNKENLLYASDYNVYKRGSDGELKKVGKWDGKKHEVIKKGTVRFY